MSALHRGLRKAAEGASLIKRATTLPASLIAVIPLVLAGCNLLGGVGAQRSVIDVTLPNGRVLDITILDDSRTLADARFANDNDFIGVQVTGGEGEPVLARTDDDRIVRVLWAGTPCDRSAQLSVSGGRGEFRLRLGARDPCDAVSVPRGVVLTFREPVPRDAAAIADS